MKWNLYGCGNIVKALAKEMFKDKTHEVSTYTPSFTNAMELAKGIGGHVFREIDLMPEAQVIMLGCKPQQVEALAKSLMGKLKGDEILISLLAGVSSERLKELFCVKKVVRLMPNTPSQVGHGVLSFYFTKEVSENEKSNLLDIFKNCGRVFALKSEDDIDKVTAHTASGPAYFFEIARIMSLHLENLGIETKMAREMVIHTLLGSAKLMDFEHEQDGDSPEVLRERVTSKGGTTSMALDVFKDAQLSKIFDRALDAAYNRALELNKS